jgi:hypothetical protein
MTNDQDTLAAPRVFERPPTDEQSGYTEREEEARREAMRTLAEFAGSCSVTVYRYSLKANICSHARQTRVRERRVN